MNASADTNKGTSLYAPFEIRAQLKEIGHVERRKTIDTLRYLIALYRLTTPVERAQILSREGAK